MISIGATTPIRLVETTRRLRHLQIPTIPATAPKAVRELAVGSIPPTNVELYPLPAAVGIKDDYRYSVVNDHTVLVEARTHKVTQIID